MTTYNRYRCGTCWTCRVYTRDGTMKRNIGTFVYCKARQVTKWRHSIRCWNCCVCLYWWQQHYGTQYRYICEVQASCSLVVLSMLFICLPLFVKRLSRRCGSLWTTRRLWSIVIVILPIKVELSCTMTLDWRHDYVNDDRGGAVDLYQDGWQRVNYTKGEWASERRSSYPWSPPGTTEMTEVLCTSCRTH